jgi:pyruvate/2-oxoglutarate dehydrogenase complex dihydrolipoamide acyltransferase (E2) component
LTEIVIPRLGVAMTEGELVGWLVEDGAQVSQGEVIYSIATDKVETDIESPSTGILHQTGEAGQTYEVGHVIGSISQ